MSKPIVGGGPKKVLYTLKTLQSIGVKNSSKALRANNTCKACGLGMGGQRGGMTNELGEFPAVCNKSVQAQSTDIQPEIPAQVFEHSIDDLKALSAKELEHMGRLGQPLYKAADSGHFKPITWQEAMSYASQKFLQCEPERSFFYSSGRSSNEAGFVLQLLARLYGTNNVNNCSYYCHQATGVGLGATIGSGTATIELEDLEYCDLVFVIGANPASNHPRFIHKLKACRERGGKVVVINPAKEPGLVRFAVPKSFKSMIAGGSEIASDYLQPKIGSDRYLINAIAKTVLENNYQDAFFIDAYCDNFEAYQTVLNALSWDEVEGRTGLTRSQIENIAQVYCSSKNVVFAWGMGITHHQFGVENVEAIANLALLRGMVGQAHRGLLPLRGHSNVQGIGTIGVKPVLADDVTKQIESTFGITLPKQKGLDTFNALRVAGEGKIDCALIMGGNLYAATPNSVWANKVLSQIPFKLFLTTTINQGHLYGLDHSEAIILPVCARDEEPQPTTQESMFNYVRMSDGGIARIQQARSEVAILSELGSTLCAHTPVNFSEFKNHDSVREAIAAIIPGMSELKDISVAKKEFHIKGRVLHEPRFGPKGKARFAASSDLEHQLICDERYPFTLATIRSEGQFNSIIYEELDSYRYDAPRDALLVSPADMDQLGVKAGDRVVVESRTGAQLRMRVHAFDVPEGNVLAYYPEANVLTEGLLDPRSLTPAFKSVAVSVKAN